MGGPMTLQSVTVRRCGSVAVTSLLVAGVGDAVPGWPPHELCSRRHPTTEGTS
jgi:hypothetical protein